MTSEESHVIPVPLCLGVCLDEEAMSGEKGVNQGEEYSLQVGQGALSLAELMIVKTHHLCTVRLVERRHR